MLTRAFRQPDGLPEKQQIYSVPMLVKMLHTEAATKIIAATTAQRPTE
jgi:hypothetical protein